MKSKIEWTDRSDWNPIRGCTRVSPGCGGPGKAGGCYAERIAARFSGPGQPFHGFAERVNGEARWTGKVGLMEERLAEPLRWRKPAKIFVCSMADLFHESVPDAWIDRVFAVMALAPQHSFQVLTKRAARMLAYLTDPSFGVRVGGALMEHARGHVGAECWVIDLVHGITVQRKPLPNIWLGVSAEDQRRADERIPHLLATPAAVRFVSLEPLLGPIDLRYLQPGDPPVEIDALHGTHGVLRQHRGVSPALDWVIVGGESGPKARPMHPQWARDLRDQCAAAGVAFHFKQWGEWAPMEGPRFEPTEESARPWPHPAPVKLWSDGEFIDIDPDEERMLVPAETCFACRVGKKAAGRLLDGVEHNGMPFR